MKNKYLLLHHFPELLRKVAETGYGWLLATLSFVANYFSSEHFSFTLVLVAIMLDALFGVVVSFKKRKFVLSKLARITIFKITSYYSALVILYMTESLMHSDNFIGVKVAAGWAAACEFWSMSANILILWPDSPFFKLIRKQLKSEIEAKLHKKMDDILKDD